MLEKKSKKKTRKGKTIDHRQLLTHDTSITLSDPDLVFEGFIQCMKEGDHDSALEILSASLRQLNKAHLERRYKIPRRTAYNLLQRKSMPGLDLVAKVCYAIRIELGAAK